jgi:hypothetical protein
MPDSVPSPEDKLRKPPEPGESAEAVWLEACDGPCVPAPSQQFHITNLQKWIDLCA